MERSPKAIEEAIRKVEGAKGVEDVDIPLTFGNFEDTLAAGQTDNNDVRPEDYIVNPDNMIAADLPEIDPTKFDEELSRTQNSSGPKTSSLLTGNRPLVEDVAKKPQAQTVVETNEAVIKAALAGSKLEKAEVVGMEEGPVEKSIWEKILGL